MARVKKIQVPSWANWLVWPRGKQEPRWPFNRAYFLHEIRNSRWREADGTARYSVSLDLKWPE